MGHFIIKLLVFMATNVLGNTGRRDPMPIRLRDIYLAVEMFKPK